MWNCRPISGVKRLGLYNISKHQTAGLEVAVTATKGGRGIQSKWKPSLSTVFGPHTKVSRRRVRQLLPLHSLTHKNTVHTGTLCHFLLHFLCLFAFISCSLTVSHTSTDPQVMTSHSDNKKLEKDHGMGWQFYSADAGTFRAVPL